MYYKKSVTEVMSYKSWVFTINNYTEKDVEWCKSLEVNRITVGKEVGENGTPHLQGYVTWKRSYRLTALKKLHDKAHWEPARAVDAANYCRKGEMVIDINNGKQGQRSDLMELKKNIEEGKSVRDIILEDPVVFHQYGRTLTKLEDVIQSKKFRKWETKGIWYWGKTGVGKSHKAFEGFDPDTHYVYKDDKGWWDGYRGQETVIINEFRGEDMDYSMMLKLTDKWPYEVKRRGREPAPFLAKTIIVTSSMKPEDVFFCHKKDKIEQLLRRFEIIEVKRDCDRD